MAGMFERLKQKCQPVLDNGQKEGAELQNVNLEGSQLSLKAHRCFRSKQESRLGRNQSS
jgi:hypothetical protein